MFFNFKGKKALVPGGGSGLGRECAILFAKAGADVLIADLKPERCEEVAAEVRKYGREAISYPLDVTNYEEVAAMYKKVHGSFCCISTRSHRRFRLTESGKRPSSGSIRRLWRTD